MKVHLHLLTLLALLFISCSRKDTSYEIIREPQNSSRVNRPSLTLYLPYPWPDPHLYSGLDAEEQIFLDMVVLKEQVLAAGDMSISLKRRWQMGDPPDMFTLWPDQIIQDFISEGQLIDLKPFLDNNPDLLEMVPFPEAINLVSREGSVYGLPLNLVLEGIFVHTDLLEQFGWDLPQSETELLALSEEALSQGITPFQITNRMDLSYLYQILVAAHSRDERYKNPHNLEGRSVYRKALLLLKEYYDRGWINQDAVNELVLSEQCSDRILEKPFLFMVQGSWALREIDETFGKENWDFIPYPSVESGGDAVYLIGTGSDTLYLTKKERSDILNHALFLCLKGYTVWMKNLQNAPDVDNSHYFDQTNRTLLEENLQLSDVRYSMPPDYFWDRYYWVERIRKKTPQYLTGKIQLDDILDLERDFFYE